MFSPGLSGPITKYEETFQFPSEMAGCAKRANRRSSTKGPALLMGVFFQSSLVGNVNKWADVSFYTKLPVLGSHRLLWDMDVWAERKLRQGVFSQGHRQRLVAVGVRSLVPAFQSTCLASATSS